MPDPVRIGVLALQGGVREHMDALTAVGAEPMAVRTPAQLAEVRGLVLPGGESSVIDRLARLFEVAGPIEERIRGGMPVLGTCAGLILLADRLLDAAPGQRAFGGIDMTVRRNAFGSQAASFEADLVVPALGEPSVRATFIRAPVIERIGAGAEALASVDGRMVAVEQGRLLATAFHPEVSGELRFHRRLLDRVAGQR